MSSASTPSPVSRSTSIRVLQLTGFFPRPETHSWRISMLISSALPRCLLVIAATFDPVSSFRSRMPKFIYLVPISRVILIFLFLPWKLSSSGRVGRLPTVQMAIDKLLAIISPGIHYVLASGKFINMQAIHCGNELLHTQLDRGILSGCLFLLVLCGWSPFLSRWRPCKNQAQQRCYWWVATTGICHANGWLPGRTHGNYHMK